ncbi:MAG: hypothetical protein H3C68_01485 [Deltaproteobacteria bacterium]|nr:hypothetical protein [Deltaproteobacteria bacterium]MBZ0219073.1 hypothetical protein [Deltaproteobacteria bacterium]
MIKALQQARQGAFLYKTQVIDLSTARNNEVLTIEGTYLFVFDATDFGSNLSVRFNEVYMDALTLTKSRGVRLPFYRVYLTNAAQPGKTLTLIYGVSDTPIEAIAQVEVVFSGAVEITEAVVEVATAPAIYNVDCPLAGTEYSQALPGGTKKFSIKARGGDLQVCFSNGQSGVTYVLLTDGQALFEDNVNLTGKTLYFQSSQAGTDAEIIAWV